MTFDPSKPYAAKHGRPVRVLASDLRGDWPIAAAHADEEGEEFIVRHRMDGRCQTNGVYNLYNVPERVVKTACMSITRGGDFTMVSPGESNVRFTFECDKLVAVELIGETQ
ncbi:MAG: hypothetical protein NUV75_00560 [Gallionella sp.]|nr:hypothetical protein [Gallionella sp.]